MREQKHKSSGTRIIILPRASLKNNGELIVVMVIYVHNESQRLAPPPRHPQQVPLWYVKSSLAKIDLITGRAFLRWGCTLGTDDILGRNMCSSARRAKRLRREIV